MPDLFTALKPGEPALPNRLVLAPLAHNRAESDDAPQAMKLSCLDAPLSQPDEETCYGGDEPGYTDYATL